LRRGGEGTRACTALCSLREDTQHTMRSVVGRVGAAALATLLLASLSSGAHAALTVASVLTAPSLLDAGGIDAHGSIAYVAGDGVTAVDVTDPDAPKVLMTLTDPLLLKCKSVYAYTSVAEQDGGAGRKRLAVACPGADALVLVDAETPGNLKVLGAVVEPVALKGVSGVVVKGTLAFVAASGVARVVSIDVRSEAKPSVLSFVKLSAASTVALHGGGLYKC
jgi:hypothetical protein